MHRSDLLFSDFLEPQLYPDKGGVYCGSFHRVCLDSLCGNDAWLYVQRGHAKVADGSWLGTQQSSENDDGVRVAFRSCPLAGLDSSSIIRNFVSDFCGSLFRAWRLGKYDVSSGGFSKAYSWDGDRIWWVLRCHCWRLYSTLDWIPERSRWKADGKGICNHLFCVLFS